jgi:hypothetical protein
MNAEKKWNQLRLGLMMVSIVCVSVIVTNCSDKGSSSPSQITPESPLFDPEAAVDPSLPPFLRMCGNGSSSTISNSLGWTPFWAQRALGVDISNKMIEQIGADLTKVKVAIIDTGFDTSGNSQNLDVSSLEVEYTGMAEFPFDAFTDPIGHGTAVAGTIAGKEGIGVAPGVQLKIFSFVPDLVKANEEAEKLIREDQEKLRAFNKKIEDSLAPAIKKAIRTACDEGYRIINMSLGNPDGNNTDLNWKTPDNLELIDWLSEKGCLIVNSSGNSAYVGDEIQEVLERNRKDSWIEVAANSYGNNLAYFSTLGEVSAPGENIFTLETSDSTYRSPFTIRCQTENSKINGQFISGTSFSSPFVAGVIALIQSVLNLSDKYKSLEKREQIQVWKKIVKEASIFGSVNGPKAINSAIIWIEENDMPNMPTEAVSCAEEKNLCDGRSPLSCSDHLRTQIMYCKDDVKSESVKLVELYLEHGHIEPAIYWLSSLARDTNGLDKKAVSSLAQNTWDKYIKRKDEALAFFSHPDRGKIDYFTGSKILSLVSLNSEIDKEVLRHAFQILLSPKDSNFWNIAIRDKGRRGLDIIEDLVALFASLESIYSFTELWSVYNSSLTELATGGYIYGLSSGRYEGATPEKDGVFTLKAFVPGFRIFNLIFERDLFKAVRSQISTAEQAFLEKFLMANGSIQIWDFAEQSFGGERVDVNEFTPLFVRQRDIFNESVAPLMSVDDSSAVNTGTLMLPYLIFADINDVLPAGSRKYFLKNMIHRSIDGQFPFTRIGSGEFPNNIPDIESLINSSFPNSQGSSIPRLPELRPDGFANRDDFIDWIKRELETSSNLFHYRYGFQCAERDSDWPHVLNPQQCSMMFVRLVEILKSLDLVGQARLVHQFHLSNQISRIPYFVMSSLEISEIEEIISVEKVGPYDYEKSGNTIRTVKPSGFETKSSSLALAYIDLMKITTAIYIAAHSDGTTDGPLWDASIHIPTSYSLLGAYMEDGLEEKMNNAAEILRKDLSWRASVEALIDIERKAEYNDHTVRNIESLLKLTE